MRQVAGCQRVRGGQRCPEEPSFITAYSPSSHRISVAAPNPTANPHDGSSPSWVRRSASVKAETRIHQFKKWARLSNQDTE